MKEKKIKYAKLLIEKCVNLQKNEPLYIEAPVETYEFVEMIYEIASKITNDIHVTFNDAKIRHDALMTLSIDEIKEHPFYLKGKEIFEEEFGINQIVRNPIEKNMSNKNISGKNEK